MKGRVFANFTSGDNPDHAHRNCPSSLCLDDTDVPSHLPLCPSAHGNEMAPSPL